MTIFARRAGAMLRFFLPPVTFACVAAVWGIVLLVPGLAAPQLANAQEPDPLKPRPPTHIEADARTRMKIVIDEYLSKLQSAIQRGDTVALRMLMPETVIPEPEKAAAQRARCSSVSSALARIGERYEGSSRNAALPLRKLRIRRKSVSVSANGRAATVMVDLLDTHDSRRYLFAPIEIQFTSARAMPASMTGGMVGICGIMSRVVRQR